MRVNPYFFKDYWNILVKIATLQQQSVIYNFNIIQKPNE